MASSSPEESSPSVRLLLKAWFSVTASERLTILVVLGLFLLGLAARAWHLGREWTPHHPAPMGRSAEP